MGSKLKSIYPSIAKIYIWIYAIDIQIWTLDSNNLSIYDFPQSTSQHESKWYMSLWSLSCLIMHMSVCRCTEPIWGKGIKDSSFGQIGWCQGASKSCPPGRSCWFPGQVEQKKQVTSTYNDSFEWFARYRCWVIHRYMLYIYICFEGFPKNHSSWAFRMPQQSFHKVNPSTPCQPVSDLESYMQSLANKQESIKNMIGKMQGEKGDDAKTFHVYIQTFWEAECSTSEFSPFPYII